MAYVISSFMLLGLSRAREYGADHWSCECTGDGDALASALVKIAYGMGQVKATEQAEAAALVASGKQGRAEADRRERASSRIRSMRAMGIFDPGRPTPWPSPSGRASTRAGRRRHALGTVNPWGATLEKLASHPLVAHRIEALEESGLPGAPTHVERAAGQRGPSTRPPVCRCGPAGPGSWRSRSGRGPCCIAVVGLRAVQPTPTVSIGLALAVAGGGLVLKQLLRYPTHGHQPVPEITSLLERLEAGPVAGIPVEVRGRIIGRGFPGYLLSPDMVVQDQSGFVPLLWRNPLPFARAWFGLAKVRQFMGADVVATGWYHRAPGPVIEVRSVQAVDGRSTRTWWWSTCYAASAAVLVIGLLVAVMGAATGA